MKTCIYLKIYSVREKFELRSTLLEENVLVVIDHCTGYAQAYVTLSQTTQTTAKALWDNFIIHYVFPKISSQIRETISRDSWWLS